MRNMENEIRVVFYPNLNKNQPVSDIQKVFKLPYSATLFVPHNYITCEEKGMTLIAIGSHDGKYDHILLRVRQDFYNAEITGVGVVNVGCKYLPQGYRWVINFKAKADYYGQINPIKRDFETTEAIKQYFKMDAKNRVSIVISREDTKK